MKNNDLIDLSSTWVDTRNGAYLAKENVIVYYASLTGRKSDFDWHTLTLIEVVRIIRATVMSASDAEKLTTNHIIAACQELDRVFEFGIKSRHKVKGDIFNYFDEVDVDVNDMVVSLMVDELVVRGYLAITLADTLQVFINILHKLNIKVPVRERTQLFSKHFEKRGYTYRSGTQRVMHKGKKTNALIMSGKKPRDILNIPVSDMKDMCRKIVGAVK